MKKRIVSLLLCVVMCFSLLPTAAFAEVVGAVDGASVVTTPAEPTEPADPVDPADPADPADPTDPADPADPVDPTDPVDPVAPIDPADPVDPVDPATPEGDDAPAVDEAVAAVQALIDALPATDFAAMTEEEIDALYAAYEAYYLLDETQKAQITGAEVFDALLAAFDETDALASELWYCIGCGQKKYSTDTCIHKNAKGKLNNMVESFTEWTETGSMPSSAGNYYLNRRVELTKSWEPASGTVLYMGPNAVIYGPAANSENYKEGGAAIIVNGGSFTLTGDYDDKGMITHKPGVIGPGVVVKSGTFNMYHGSISGNNAFPSSDDHVADYGKCAGGVTIKSGTFNMYGGTISNNNNYFPENFKDKDTSEYYGGGVCNRGTFNMSGGTISDNNKASDTWQRKFYGGGVCNFTKATFNMTGGKITNNIADEGCGVYNGISGYNDTDRATFTMSGGEISNNQIASHYKLLSGDKIPSTAKGGGVYNSANGIFTLTGGEIKSNAQPEKGGGVYNLGSFTMSGGIVKDNKANIHGGGVYNIDGATFAMSNGTISGNTVVGTSEDNSSGRGGGVYNEGDFTLTGGTISDNKATDRDGGGVYTNKELTIGDGVTISGNAAKWGGGVYTLAKLTITGGEITGNTAQSDGGGVFVAGDNHDMSMSGGKINNNTANSVGGGVYFRVGKHTFALSGGEINGNLADNGGGVYVNNGTLAMTGGKINNNNAAISNDYNGEHGHGAGVYINGGKKGGDSVFNFEGGEIAGNTSYKSGGGVYNSGTVNMSGSAVISGNCASDNEGPYGNSAKYSGGGGVYNDRTFNMSGGTIKDNKVGKSIGNGGGVNNLRTFTMTGGTISNNSANGDGGGVCSYKTFNMSGGIISGDNRANNGGGVYNDGTFTLSGDAVITGNRAYTDGGGVLNGNTFNLNGGTISSNKAGSAGGGVFTRNKLNMTGGTITGNEARSGGGIFNTSTVSNPSSMSGGSVIGNKATEKGGGIFNQDGLKAYSYYDSWSYSNVTVGSVVPKFTVSGGTITGNTAGQQGGGVYVNHRSLERTSDSEFHVSGNAKITGNTVNGTENNVGLHSSESVIVDSATFSGSVGVTSDKHEVGQTVLSGSATAKACGYFTSDKGGFIVDTDGKLTCGHLYLEEQPDGTYKCKDCHAVIASIVATVTRGAGESETTGYYPSVEAAAAAVTNGSTLTLLVDQKYAVVLEKDVEYTLNVNGKALNMGIQVNGGTVTIKGIAAEDVASAPNLNIGGGTVILGENENYRNVAVNGGKVEISNGKFNKLTVRNDGDAELSGGQYNSVWNYRTDEKAKDLLKDENYRYWKLEKNDWYAGTYQSVSNTIVADKNTVLMLSIGGVPAEALTYGYTQPVTLTANMIGGNDDETNVYTYEWYLNGGTDTVSTAKTYTFTIGKDAGTYTIKCVVTYDDKEYTDTATITVEKQTLPTQDQNWPTGATNLVYDGTSHPLAKNPVNWTETSGWKVLYKQADGTWKTNIPEATKAGAYTVYWYIDGGDNYHDVASRENPRQQHVTIAPQKVKITDATIKDKIYDGETTATVEGVTFKTVSDTDTSETLQKIYDYHILYTAFEDANVGNNKKVTIKVQLLNDNYTFVAADGSNTDQQEYDATGNIIPITVSTATPLKRHVRAGETYTYDLNELLKGLTGRQEFGTITWTDAEISYPSRPDGQPIDTPYIDNENGGITLTENSQLTLKIKDSGITGADNLIGTLTLEATAPTIKTDGTAGLQMKVELYLTGKKLVVRPASGLNPSPITYGQPLWVSTFTKDPVEAGTETNETPTTVQGTFQWVTPNRVPEAGSRWAEWTFTPTNTADYATVNGASMVTVHKATPDIYYTNGGIDIPANPGTEYNFQITKTYNATTFTFSAEHAVYDPEGLNADALGYVTKNVDGTWSWAKVISDGSTISSAAPVNVADSGKYAVTFTPTDTTNYNEGTFYVTVTINKRPVSISAVRAWARDYEEGNTKVELTGGELAAVDGVAGSGIVPSDASRLSFALGLGTMVDENGQPIDSVGENNKVKTEIQLIGEVMDNYRLVQPDDLTATISGKAITEAMITVTGDLTYNGTEQSPTVVVKDGEKTLVEGTDYTLSGNKQDDADSYTLTVTAKGNYTGTVENLPWEIAPRQITRDMVTITNPTYNESQQSPTVTVKAGETTTLTQDTDYSLDVTPQTDAGSYRLNVAAKSDNYTGSVSCLWYIEPQVLTAAAAADDKAYDGTTDAVAAVTFSKADGGDTVELEENQYTVSAAFENAAVGAGKKVAVLVTLLDPNYCFEVVAAAEPPVAEPETPAGDPEDDTEDDAADDTAEEVAAVTPDSATQKTLYATAAIIRAQWTGSRPTAKENPLRVTQDQTIRSGDVNLVENLPENIPGIREGSFTVGTTSAKVTATVDESGKLSFTITGGKSGDRLTIPVTFTCTNYLVGEGVPLTISFDVVVELTGMSQDPIHRQPIFTGTAGGNGGAAGGTSAGADVTSPDTGDAGIAVYAMLSLCAALGTGVTLGRKKRRD